LTQPRTLLEIRGLSVKYPNGVSALEDINLDICEGDLVALIGPNGAGKSTLLKAILGLIKPTSGSIKLLGCADLGKNLKSVGYVPQTALVRDQNLPFTVYETVLMGRTSAAGLLHGLGKTDRQKVDEVLRLFGIYELKDRKIGQLSGGQSQRVFLAKAMVAEPKLLLLDEPTSGVDMASKQEFYSILERLNRERSLAVILSSHDVGVVTKIANRVLCINRSQFFCGLNQDFAADKEIHRMYNHNVELMDHADHA
jgi:ABC-type Mn/Zn transport systems, ATPase component